MSFKSERKRQIFIERYYDSAKGGEEALLKAKIILQDQVVKLNDLYADIINDPSGVISMAELGELTATVIKFENWINAINSALQS